MKGHNAKQFLQFLENAISLLREQRYSQSYLLVELTHVTSSRVQCADALQNRIAGNISLRACNFIKKRLQHRRSSVKTVKFLRTPFLTELHWLLLSGTGYTVVTTWHRWKKHDVLRNSEHSIPTFLTKILVANRFSKKQVQ